VHLIGFIIRKVFLSIFLEPNILCPDILYKLFCNSSMNNIPHKNCIYKCSSWWWTHDVRNTQKTPRIELKY